jgi:hypothetical protein
MSGRCDDDKDDLTLAYLWGQSEARDEIKRLREALRFYACQCKDDMSCETFGEYGRSECGHTARAALGEDK